MQLTLKFGAIAASELREAASLSDEAVPQPLPGAQARIDLILESMPGIIVHISQFLPSDGMLRPARGWIFFGLQDVLRAPQT